MPQSRIERAIADFIAPADPARVNEFAELLSEATNAAERRLGTVDDLIDRLAEFMPEPPDRAWLASLYGASSAEEYAETWTAPVPSPLKDLTRDEILALLRAHDDAHPSRESERLAAYLESALPKVFTSDLIYHPYDSWTTEELADEIVRRRTLLETGGDSALEAYEYERAEGIAADPTSPLWARQWAGVRLYPSNREKQLELLEAWQPPAED